MAIMNVYLGGISLQGLTFRHRGICSNVGPPRVSAPFTLSLRLSPQTFKPHSAERILNKCRSAVCSTVGRLIHCTLSPSPVSGICRGISVFILTCLLLYCRPPQLPGPGLTPEKPTRHTSPTLRPRRGSCMVACAIKSSQYHANHARKLHGVPVILCVTYRPRARHVRCRASIGKRCTPI
jgi:hypothetical protein